MRKPLSLQRRHFELIAKTISELPATATREQVASVFASALASTNPQFQRERFLAASNGH